MGYDPEGWPETPNSSDFFLSKLSTPALDVVRECRGYLFPATTNASYVTATSMIAARVRCAKLINRKRFDKYEKEDAVSIGRVSMMEFSSKEEADHSEELYDKIEQRPFPHWS